MYYLKKHFIGDYNLIWDYKDNYSKYQTQSKLVLPFYGKRYLF